MIEVKFYSLVVNNGDGSASVLFFADRETAQIACDYEEKSGDAFTENEPLEETLRFDEKGKLLTPDSVRDYLE